MNFLELHLERGFCKCVVSSCLDSMCGAFKSKKFIYLREVKIFLQSATKCNLLRNASILPRMESQKNKKICLQPLINVILKGDYSLA